MTAGRRTLAALVALLATALLSFAGSAQQAAQNPRIALVIGNATYRDAALATSANDAGLVAQTLQAAGFDVVGARDLDGQSLRTAFRDFLDKASAAGPDMQAFVYLAGRGVSSRSTRRSTATPTCRSTRSAFPTSPTRWRRRRARPASSCSMRPAPTRMRLKGRRLPRD
jgi:uncharacterized caspase-like protein